MASRRPIRSTDVPDLDVPEGRSLLRLMLWIQIDPDPLAGTVLRTSMLRPLLGFTVAHQLLIALLPAQVSSVRAADGRQLAAQLCASCHGEELTGARVGGIRGANWRRARNDTDAMRIIAEGIPGTEMPPFGAVLSATDQKALMAYIRSPAPAQKTPEIPRVGRIIRTKLQDFRLEQVAKGFETPWSMAFLPDGRLMVTERPGRLRIVEGGKLSEPIRGIPKVWFIQDAGLLSLALDPDYTSNGWIYLSYAEPGAASRTSMTKIVRGRVVDRRWKDQQVIWQADARYYWEGDDHYGCRLLFHEGKLFFSIGDRGHRPSAQDLSNPCGKIHRINPDGSIPIDNPYVKTQGAYPSVWSYGHRNPQGLAIDARTGELWSVEHGPMGGDELNRVRPTQNYGWPVVTFGREHSGEKISAFTSQPGMIDPVVQWTPSIAVCPVHLSDSDRYPKWKHQLLVGSLSLQEFHRIQVSDDRVVDHELLFKNLGRIRDIKTGPEGYLYLVIEHAGRSGEIVRLVPLP
jgi:aldose sugar dehydrogenase